MAKRIEDRRIKTVDHSTLPIRAVMLVPVSNIDILKELGPEIAKEPGVVVRLVTDEDWDLAMQVLELPESIT